MRKGFTLLELIVVIIIIGILATLGFVQYSSMIEKGRKAEANANLGALRQMQLLYYQERSVYGTLANIGSPLPAGDAAGACSGTNATQYYFGYLCVAASGTCNAYRCTGGGRDNVATADTYSVTLTIDGGLSSTK